MSVARMGVAMALAALGAGCGSGAGAKPSSDAGTSGDSTSAGPGDGAAGASGSDGSGGASPGSDGATAGGGDGATAGDAAPLSRCVPAIPQLPWTSPYAGWSRGIPTDPSFFPIAVWLQGSWHATELHNLGINIYVGNNGGTDALMASDLATLHGLGMYAIIGQDSTGLASINDRTVVGWWMDPDEPDNAQPASSGGYGPPVNPSTLVSRYNSYKAMDSTRPIYLGLGQGVAFPSYEGRGSNPPAESGYVPASDIIDFDIYPYNNCGGDANEQMTCGQFWLNAKGIDNLRSWSNRNQAAWTDIETTVIAAGTTTGPTPKQTKSEAWLSLIHGANGIAYFIDTWQPSFREDGIFADNAMVTAVTALNQQITSLAPELNSASLPNLVTVSYVGAPIDLVVKAHGTSIYVLSAISGTGTSNAAFTIAGSTAKGTATVIGENRIVYVTAGSFSDSFAANDVHLYEIDFSTLTCP